ncbi:GNAT family N-acetyltransferase [Candidatus Saccharibacteria bacterium]|nr:GNAT family N-acetyltransferase [Candidatus Saccharibacteria bacterium]
MTEICPRPKNNARLRRHEAEPPVNIRRFDAGRHSSEEIARIHLSVRRRQEESGENSFRDILDSQKDLGDIPAQYLAPGGSFFIAENAEGSVIGFVGLKRDQSEPAVGILKRLAVLPEYRGRDIGYRLVGELVGWAKANGCGRIKLATGLTERAYGIYARHGFIETGFNADSQDFLMELDLENARLGQGPANMAKDSPP